MFSRSSNKEFPGRHKVGWVQSAHGIRGEIFVRLSAGSADWLHGLKHLYLLSGDSESLSEHKVSFARPHKDGLIVKLADVVDRNRSEELRKSSVYIDSELLTAEPGERIYLGQILGFEVLDRGVAVGKITGFTSNGPQDLLQVAGVKGEILIPFVDDFIVDINFDGRIVNMSLPDGLLSIDE